MISLSKEYFSFSPIYPTPFNPLSLLLSTQTLLTKYFQVPIICNRVLSKWWVERTGHFLVYCVDLLLATH